MSSFQELFDQCAILAFEKQAHLSSLVGKHEWLLNVEKAYVNFNKEIVFDVQFLGTESALSKSWLWANANNKNGFPNDSLAYCRQVRSTGTQHGLDEFISNWFCFVDEIGRPTSDTLAMVATCMGGASCYYKAPHSNGAVFFVLADSRIDAQPDLNLERFSNAFNDLIWVPWDMKKRVISYLSKKGFIGRDFAGNELDCQLSSGEKVKFRFETREEGGTAIIFEPVWGVRSPRV
jgi:hypothetical protein